MLKYVNTQVGFREVPDKISLLINISGCKCHCQGCHSKYLWDDIGDPLDTQAIDALVEKNKGINCVCLMGGEDFKEVGDIASYIHSKHGLLVAWYTGHVMSEIPSGTVARVDFLKVGPYKEECGPLDKETTNQRMYKVHVVKGLRKNKVTGQLEMCFPKLEDITHKFWRKATQ